MTSFGGPSLGPESPAHGSQRVYLGQMVKGVMVQPWSLGQPENIWHGMLRWCTHAPHHTAECRPSLETGGERRFSFSACQWPSKDSILSLSLALSLQRLRTRPDLPDNNILQ